MRNINYKKREIAGGFLAAVIVVLLIAFVYGLSWLITCGIIKLVTICFGVPFKWSISTGIWLVICLLRSIFRITITNKH